MEILKFSLFLMNFPDPKLMSVGETKWRDMQEWLNKRIDEAYEAAKQSEIDREYFNHNKYYSI